jgi:hypothetical protein
MAQRRCQRPSCQLACIGEFEIADLGGRNDGEGTHHSVWVFLPDLRDQKCTHTSTSTTTKRVGDLETLKTVGCLGLSSDNIENRVNELGTFSVMTLCPIVTSTALTKDAICQLCVREPERSSLQVIRSEEVS